MTNLLPNYSIQLLRTRRHVPVGVQQSERKPAQEDGQDHEVPQNLLKRAGAHLRREQADEEVQRKREEDGDQESDYPKHRVDLTTRVRAATYIWNANSASPIAVCLT